VTLQDLGSIGDFIGGIAVIITLLYLANQIRQNTNSVLGSVESEDNRGSSDFLQSLAENPGLARIWRLGHSDPAKLTADEGTQFVMLMGAAFYRLAGSFRQYKRGLLSEDSWEPYERLISRYLASPAVLEWWSRGDVPFAQSFIDYVNARISASSNRETAPAEGVLTPVWPDMNRSNPE
jgi:hypothetical protein